MGQPVRTAIMPGAEPFAFEPDAGGAKTGVLLIHGYTGAPQGMREWGESLASRGYTVICPRLPGHGTRPEDLHATSYADWRAEAERGFRGLTERCENVFIGALSMGALIALDLAARYPDDVAGLTLANPFLFSKDPLAKLAPLLGKVSLLIKGVYNDVADPERKELGYPKQSTKASASLLKAAAEVRTRLPKVKSPAVLFVSKQDHVVDNDCARAILSEIGSAEKEIVWLERSYHVATIDLDREIIFEQSAKFIAAHTSSTEV
ncbi:MAG: alpha/beta fold hydrolase [Actinomycetota bacterium]